MKGKTDERQDAHHPDNPSRRSRWLPIKRAQALTGSRIRFSRSSAPCRLRPIISSPTARRSCAVNRAETNCCCAAGVRPGVYATEVNIQNLNLVTAPVLKFVLPLINSGAVVAREPNVADAATLPARQVDVVKLPPLAATMDDCCRIAEMLLGASPSGDAALTIAILTIVSPFELSVSVVYTANPFERRRHQHRRRIHSVATAGTSWPGLTDLVRTGRVGADVIRYYTGIRWRVGGSPLTRHRLRSDGEPRLPLQFVCAWG